MLLLPGNTSRKTIDVFSAALHLPHLLMSGKCNDFDSKLAMHILLRHSDEYYIEDLSVRSVLYFFVVFKQFYGVCILVFTGSKW